MNLSAAPGGPEANRRRSQRVLLSINVTVMGESPPGKTFTEETQTLVVNAHGALIALSAPVVSGQQLRLTNKASHEEEPCRVVYLGPKAGGKTQVGIEFTKPAPNFWHIAFPPEDWTPRSPEARTARPRPRK